MSTSTTELDAVTAHRVQVLWDRQEISDVMLRFGRDFLIDLDGDEASGVFYHVSRHRKPNRHGQDQYTQYGWYENRFRRTGDGWKITVLKHRFQWCDGNPTLIDTSDPAWQAVADEIFGGAA